MPKYQRSDDGKIVDGKIVVWPASAVPGGNGKSAAPSVTWPKDCRAARNAAARNQAAALAAAAQSGAPFCEDCERARKRLEELEQTKQGAHT